MKRRIAIVAGGFSGEAGISMKSAMTIMESIDLALYEPYLIEVSRSGWSFVKGTEREPIDLNDFSITVEGTKFRFDYAYIIIHGDPGENGKIQGYLDMMSVPYNTGDALSMAVSFNKGATQRLLKSQGIQVSNFIYLRKGQVKSHDKILQTVGLPCFVKPTEAGSSLGISKVKIKEDLPAALARAFEEDDEIIIEAFLDGREITCGAFRSNGEVTALPITEIITANEFFDYEAKYNDERTKEITPADISDDVAQRCSALTEQVYNILNCKGIVRIDYFLCDEDIYVLEINAIPGMSKESLVPKQLRAANMDLQELITSGIESEFDNKS